jgi:type IV pilus assembly protein PilV
MVMMFKSTNDFCQRGVSLIEVLVTVIILSIGLLGIFGLQSRLQTSEMEAYQRSQALLLLSDMANRIAVNRNAAESYASATSEVGAGMTCPTTTATQQQRDTGEWCEALKGAGEVAAGNKLGALIGGRGCVESLGGGEYMVTVAWQGLMPLTAPPESVSCGAGSYDGAAGSACVDDLCRRVVTTIVRVANLGVGGL